MIWIAPLANRKPSRRLLGVSDDATLLSTVVFILNCVHSSRQEACVSDVSTRMQQLVYSL